MAITKEWTIEKICKIIRDKRLYRVKDIVAYIPYERTQLYEKFITSDKSNTIKKELENQKISWKQELREKFMISKNPILQLALYKLMSDEEELSALTVTKNDNKTDITSGGEKISFGFDKLLNPQPEKPDKKAG